MNMTPTQATPSGFGILDRLGKKVVSRQFSGITRGEVVLRDTTGTMTYGTRNSEELSVTMEVHRPRFFRQAMFGGTLSVAESYLQGDWDCNDLTKLFRIFIRNRAEAGRLDGALTNIVAWGHRLLHWWRDNTRTGSQKNISAHYDLGNEFYRLWLDETLAYSSAIFPYPNASLQAASLEKFDRVCRKLDLQPQDRLLEIGTGWGGFALHAAEQYGCHVTTTTISREQYVVAEQRFRERGNHAKIELLQKDYRDLTGQYQKLVSIEMIEAVGYRYFDQYFRQCSKLLQPDGTFVLQAIVMPESGYQNYLNSVDFIQRYVFPGGCLPSLAAILQSVGRTTDLRFVHAEDFAPHYAETLRRWRQAFFMQLDHVRKLGFDNYFIRLWNYYLCYCEAAFEERCIGVLQIQFDKPACRRDPLSIGKQAARISSHSDSKPHLLPTQSASACQTSDCT